MNATINTNINDYFKSNTGYFSINFGAVGFWSSSIITVYVQRWGTLDETKSGWAFSFTNSSGGHDAKAEITEAQRARNYADAMNLVAMTMEQLEGETDKLEAGYQYYVENVSKPHAAKEKAERLQREKETEEDVAISKEEVIKVVKNLAAGETVTFKRRKHCGTSDVKVYKSEYDSYVLHTNNSVKCYATVSFVQYIANGHYSKDYAIMGY